MNDEEIKVIAQEEKDRVEAVMAANKTAWDRAMSLVNIQQRLQAPVAGPRWWQRFTLRWCPQCGQRLSRQQSLGRMDLSVFVYEIDHDSCACGYEYAMVARSIGVSAHLHTAVLKAAEKKRRSVDAVINSLAQCGK